MLVKEVKVILRKNGHVVFSDKLDLENFHVPTTDLLKEDKWCKVIYTPLTREDKSLIIAKAGENNSRNRVRFYKSLLGLAEGGVE